MRRGILWSLIVMVLFSLSCHKLGQKMTSGPNTLIEEQLSKEGSIPLKYGKLISVTNIAEYPYWLQLWFQNEDGDIRIVRYNINDNHLAKISHLIPRN